MCRSAPSFVLTWDSRATQARSLGRMSVKITWTSHFVRRGRAARPRQRGPVRPIGPILTDQSSFSAWTLAANSPALCPLRLRFSVAPLAPRIWRSSLSTTLSIEAYMLSLCSRA